MKICHIVVSAICDKFYLSFFEKLKEAGLEQIVVCPYSKTENSAEEISSTESRYKAANIELTMLPIKKTIDKLLYFKKIYKYARQIENGAKTVPEIRANWESLSYEKSIEIIGIHLLKVLNLLLSLSELRHYLYNLCRVYITEFLCKQAHWSKQHNYNQKFLHFLKNLY